MRESDKYLEQKGLTMEGVEILCDILDRRSVSTSSYERSEKKLVLALVMSGFITKENYANGEYNLLTDEGYRVSKEFTRICEREYEAINVERAATADARGYRLFGHPTEGAPTAPLELHEMTICATPKGLRDLAAHLLEVAAEMDKTSQDRIDGGAHWHFQPDSRPEVVVCGQTTSSKALPPLVYDEATDRVYRKQ